MTYFKYQQRFLRLFSKNILQTLKNIFINKRRRRCKINMGMFQVLKAFLESNQRTFLTLLTPFLVH
jgi:hypothetical protein